MATSVANGNIMDIRDIRDIGISAAFDKAYIVFVCIFDSQLRTFAAFGFGIL